MERKLIKQGGGGFTIYLPKKWLDMRGLKEGDIININENENSLIIEGKSNKNESITLELNSDSKENIKNILTHVYRKGFNKITIKNVSLENIKEIKKVTSELLLGFELTNKSDNECTIENISEPSENKYDSVLRKVFLSIKESLDLLINNFDNFNDTFNELEEIKNNNVKLVLFCRRITMKEKYYQNMSLNWELLTFLSHVQKNIFYTYKFAYENKVKKDKDIIDMLEKSKEMFTLVEKAFYEKDSSYLDKLQKLSIKYAYKDIIELIKKSKGKEAVIFAYNKELLRLIKTTGSPVRSLLIEV